jgi:hypothetical protein
LKYMKASVLALDASKEAFMYFHRERPVLL